MFLLGFMGFCWIAATVQSAPATTPTQQPISALPIIRGLVELLIDNNIELSASVLEDLGLLPKTTNTTPRDAAATVQSTPTTTNINALSIIRGLIEILYKNNIRLSASMLVYLLQLSTTTSTTSRTTSYICAHLATSPPCRFNSIHDLQTFNRRNDCQGEIVEITKSTRSHRLFDLNDTFYFNHRVKIPRALFIYCVFMCND